MQTNFLIIGSGISGLNFALHAAEKGKVTLVTKKKIVDSNTNYAQGGIAAVLDKTDDFKKHVSDTLEAGAYHNDVKAVEFLAKNSANAVYRLANLGVEFENKNGILKLTKEAGHHQSRIAYVGDYTGREIEKTLVKRVRENSNIKILENTFAIDLIVKNKKCLGAQIIHKNKIENIFAQQTIIATGGIGQVFKNTTNPTIATGDGIAMAIRAGAKTKDMEFIQFHPSAFAKNIKPRFLISETVRGEGAKLLNCKGERFMEKRHPLKDLAPRSVVAKEVYKELKKGPVYLDITFKNKKFLKKRFPDIYAKLKKYGLDLANDKIPITPAAHYLCGGISTDLHGRTNIKNLFTFGESACTGVHGANRLASNSLVEALVFSNQISKLLKSPTKNYSKITDIKLKKYKLIPKNSKETKLVINFKKQIQNIMWEYAGIARNLNAIKKEAIPKIEKILAELNNIIGKNLINTEIAEAKNMAEISLEILNSAFKRKKSLGCHFVE